MDPNSGRVVTDEELRRMAPAEAEKFTVRLEGSPEDVRRISDAVKAAARRRNKAARKARRKGRR